jgi:hypothetical protein
MEKAIKVIESCTNLEQLESAKNYQFLYLDSISWETKSTNELREIFLNQYVKLLRS